MFSTLKELYKRGKIKDAGIYKAVSDNIITQEQAEQIINKKGE